MLNLYNCAIYVVGNLTFSSTYVYDRVFTYVILDMLYVITIYDISTLFEQDITQFHYERSNEIYYLGTLPKSIDDDKE